MANMTCTQVNLAFQTLDEIEQDLLKARKYLSIIHTKIKEATEKGERRNIRVFMLLELNNLHWCFRNTVQREERLNAILTNIELMG